MCLVILIEYLLIFRVYFIAIGAGGLHGHLDAAVRHERALQRLVRLKTDHFLVTFQFIINIPRTICGKACDDLGLALKDTAAGSLFLLKFLQSSPKFVRSFCRACKEALIAFINRIIILDEISYIDVIRPVRPFKTTPGIITNFHIIFTPSLRPVS